MAQMLNIAAGRPMSEELIKQVRGTKRIRGVYTLQLGDGMSTRFSIPMLHSNCSVGIGPCTRAFSSDEVCFGPSIALRNFAYLPPSYDSLL